MPVDPMDLAHMQYKVTFFEGALFDPTDPYSGKKIMSVGTFRHNAPFADPDNGSSVVFLDLVQATAQGLTLAVKLQKNLLLNVRFIVEGRVCGDLGSEDDPDFEPILDGEGDDYLYIMGDGPNPAIEEAMKRFNRKKRALLAGPATVKPVYIPVDVVPEVNDAAIP